MTKATTEVGTAAARHDAARDNARCARLRRGSPRPRLKGMQLTLTSRVAPIALGVDRRGAILFDEFFKRQCKRPILEIRADDIRADEKGRPFGPAWHGIRAALIDLLKVEKACLQNPGKIRTSVGGDRREQTHCFHDRHIGGGDLGKHIFFQLGLQRRL